MKNFRARSLRDIGSVPVKFFACVWVSLQEGVELEANLFFGVGVGQWYIRDLEHERMMAAMLETGAF